MTDAAFVHVIDDDDAVRDSLAFLLDCSGIAHETYASAVQFLAVVASKPVAGCIVSDIRMPEMDGLELQRRLSEQGVRVPVIFITGHGDVPIAVAALKQGAADFFEKPFEDDALLAAIRSALHTDSELRARREEWSEIERHLDTLTPRERDVLNELVDGHPNKVIAYRLGMSPRTVEVHRARVMEKMQVRSLSELVRAVLVLRGTIEPRQAG